MAAQAGSGQGGPNTEFLTPHEFDNDYELAWLREGLEVAWRRATGKRVNPRKMGRQLMPYREFRVSSLFPAIVVLVAVLLAPAQAALAQVQALTAECTTRQTGGDGARHRCTSDPQTIVAPEDHVLIENSLKIERLSRNGTGGYCSDHIEWGNYVEIIPGSGITQPTSLTVHVSARSPRGYWTGRGWIRCRFTVKMGKFRLKLEAEGKKD